MDSHIGVFSKSLVSLFAASALTLSLSASAVNVQLSESPTDDLSVTVKAIQSATQSLYINSYELTSTTIADAIMTAIQNGVHVEILQEGQPVGGFPKAGLSVRDSIVEAMGRANADDHYYLMTSGSSKNRSSRRFHYDHAKYIIVDESSLVVGSENYSDTGNPETGHVGTRGWEVWAADANLAAQFKAMFTFDTDTSYGDIDELTDSSSHEYGDVPFLSTLTALKIGRAGSRSGLFAAASSVASLVNGISSPDQILSGSSNLPGSNLLGSSLSGITSLLSSATQSIDIEQMEFYQAWGKSNTSPLYNELVAAARRGVKVRVLLNPASAFSSKDSSEDSSSYFHEFNSGYGFYKSSKKRTDPNQEMVDALNQAASQGGLSIEARMADVKAMGVDYIHNKGALVDGNQTLVSSINWDENSVEHNREAAVILTGPDINAHYEQLFQSDWDNSAPSAQYSGQY